MPRRNPPPTLLGPLRRPAPLVAVAGLLVFVVLALRYAGDPDGGRVDEHVESLVDSVTRYGWVFFLRVAQFGSPVSVVLWAFVIAALALMLRRSRAAVFAIAGPGLTGLATTGLKPVVGRTLGAHAGYAYPSGHTAGATAVALAAGLLLVSLVPARRAVAAALVTSAALLAGGAVGAGMVTAGAHYPTDTIGGFCLAVAIGLGAAVVIDRVADRWAARRAPTRGTPAPPAAPPAAPPPPAPPPPAPSPPAPSPAAPRRTAPPPAAPPSTAPPSVAPPSTAPPSTAPPSVAPPRGAPPG